MARLLWTVEKLVALTCIGLIGFVAYQAGEHLYRALMSQWSVLTSYMVPGFELPLGPFIGLLG